MPARRLLLLDGTRLSAWHWRTDGPEREGEFAADEAGLTAFGAYLQGCRSSLFYMLADVAEEGFQVEEVPFVHGRDRRSLIQRKLAQFFYATPLSTAISLGRSGEGRRDERILFSGLTGYAQFEPWLLRMREAECQLIGIHTMPMVVAKAIARQIDPASPTLVISATRAGLRQTFFERGQMRFSRLTAIPGGQSGDIAETCATESQKIYQYLAAQRMIDRDTPLATLVLAHPTEVSAIRGRCRNSEKLRYQFVELPALARGHGLGDAQSGALTDRLFLHLLVRDTPQEQFAPAAERHFYRLWQARFGLGLASIGILAVCALVALGQLFSLYNLSQRQEELQFQLAVGRHRYETTLAHLPKIPLGSEELRAVTDRSDLLLRRSPGLEPAFQRLSAALTKEPRIELSSLEWRLANAMDVRGNGPATRTDVATGNGNFVLLDVQGQLPLTMIADHRAQIETVNALIDVLKTEGAEVRILSLPFETESGKLLKSGVESAARSEAPRFSLRVGLPL